MELKKQIEEARRFLLPDENGQNVDHICFPESELKSLLETGIEDAIWDYLHDKSDKAHINTLEDWVKDYFQGLDLFE